MTAGKYNFIIEQGCTWQETLTLYDDNDTIISLAGFTADMHIKSAYTDSTSILDVGPYITLGGAAGTISILVPYTYTSALTFDTAIYDLELTTGSTVTRLLEGSVILSKEVTK